VQLQKAAAVYRRAPRYTANLGLGEFYLGGGTDKGRGTRLYLPLMEAGKTIVIRDIWYYALDSSTGNQTLRHATNETYRVNASPTDFEFLGRGMLTWIDILDNHHSPSDTAVRWAFDVPAQPAQGVAGISLKVRVLWNNGGSVTQTTAGNIATTRWRRQDLDTFLTRGSK
jgi:hypothetical protein